MGIFDSIKQAASETLAQGVSSENIQAQFLDVITWEEDDQETIVWRFPVHNRAIQDGGKLVVNEGQAAVFVNEGQLSEVFGPGTYTLNTNTKALTGFFETIKYQFNYPYKGDIFFVSTRSFETKWGTPTPLMLEDETFGMVEARAFGIFEYRVQDPGKLLTELVGNLSDYSTKKVSERLKNQMLAYFQDALGEMGTINVARMLGQTIELGDAVKSQIGDKFNQKYGIGLVDFTISNLNIPEEIRKEMREVDMERARMRRLNDAVNEAGGNFAAIQQHRMVEAMNNAATNTSGGGNPMMNAGLGAGMGMGMGNMMSGMMAQQPAQGGQVPPPPGAAPLHYHGPDGQLQITAQQIAQKVVANRAANHQVYNGSAWVPWQQVPAVATAVQAAAPPPPPPSASPAPPPPPTAAPDVRFSYHGAAGQSEKAASEIAALIKANPAERHLVWKSGWGNWKPAKDVPEIQAFLNAGPPPVPSAGGGPPPPPV